MTQLSIGNRLISCAPDETVLDALLRENINIPYGCKQGACQSCLVRSKDGKPPELAQNGLKSTQKQQNHFFACLCHPEQDMTIELLNQATFFTKGSVLEKQKLSDNTLLLIIQCQDVLDYFAGQFVNLQRGDGLTRSYSIANTPQLSNNLEFHIRLLPGGKFSEWVHHELKVGDTISISEPQGHCFYIPERSDQGILMVGTGSGLAPLVGILKDALHHGHHGPIHLFHGSREIHDLYHIDEMRQLAKQQKNFFYTPCLSGETVPDGFASGRANDIAHQTITNLKNWRVFLCGNPDMINQMQRDAFLSGASTQDIYTDAFFLSI